MGSHSQMPCRTTNRERLFFPEFIGQQKHYDHVRIAHLLRPMGQPGPDTEVTSRLRARSQEKTGRIYLQFDTTNCARESTR